MSVRRLPPSDNPFRPLRCRDAAILLFLVASALWACLGLVAAWLAGAL